MTALEPAGESCADCEPATISPTLGPVFYRRLQRLKAGLLPANWSGESEFEYVHAEDGRPTGSVSVTGTDGGRIWLVPPAGSKAGDAVPEQEAA